MSLPATVSDILEGKTPAKRVIELCIDGAVAEQMREAEVNLETAKQLAKGDPNDEDKKRGLAEAQERYDAIRPTYEECTREMVVQSIGRDAYRKLYDAHQASGPQRAKAKKEGRPEPGYNLDSFPPAIIAASLVQPELTVEQVEGLFASDQWNDAELQLLTYAAIGVNQSTAVVSLKKGFDSTFG